ncbi:MAG: electron transfer flavoprotein subunit alpha/FixB family protein [Victivallales bacterium]|nr:electron transfer flavoprotein subunit alpha/FixB family protein [Victivallales bacterium]
MRKSEDFKDIWILAEQHEGKVQEVSFELVARGLELRARRGCALNAMIFGDEIEEQGLQALIECGVDTLVFVKSPLLGRFRTDPYAACMLRLIEKYMPETVLAAATSTGRTLMPFVAIKADTGLTADCTVLEYDPDREGDLLQTRPAIGGNIMATIRTPDHRPQMATVRPKSIRAARPVRGHIGKLLIEKPESMPEGRVRLLGFIPQDDEIALQDADKVVVVGRGIKKAANIAAAKEFANNIGAALGATRDVVDRGWLSYPHQIGLSGKTITPKIYIGLGVSGAIQHLAGMQTSGAIIAVNKDPEAQIFKVADLGIVGDVFDVLPALKEAVGKVLRKTAGNN